MEILMDVSSLLPPESEETLSSSLPDLEDPGRLVFIFLSQGQVSQGKLRPAQSLQTGGSISEGGSKVLRAVLSQDLGSAVVDHGGVEFPRQEVLVTRLPPGLTLLSVLHTPGPHHQLHALRHQPPAVDPGDPLLPSGQARELLLRRILHKLDPEPRAESLSVRSEHLSLSHSLFL